LDVDGLNVTNLTQHPVIRFAVTSVTEHLADDEVPAWSNDGSKIAFQSYRQHNWDIYVVCGHLMDNRLLTPLCVAIT